MAYDLEVRQRSRDLFVESALSYEDVAKQTGVSVNNLKKWGGDDHWTEQRKEHQQGLTQFHAKIGKLKLQLVDAAIDTGDAQKVYALASLMRVGHAVNGAGTVDKPALFIEFLGKFMEHLKAKDPDSLRYLEPHIRGFAEEMKA